MTTTKYYRIFLIDRERGNEVDGKLRYRIRWGGNTVAFNLGYRVEFAKWSTDTQRCKGGTTHGSRKVAAAVINREITRYEQAADQAIAAFELQGVAPDKEQLRAEMLRLTRGIDLPTTAGNSSLPNAIDEFIMEMSVKNSWSDGTAAHFRTLKRHILDFDPAASFDGITEKWLMGYVAHLQDNYGNKNTTAAKQLNFIRWFLRWATRRGYNTNRAFETFRPKLKIADRKIIFLDWEELMAVYNYELPPSKRYLERVRDVFLFCCFTGLRYSDVAHLRRCDISGGTINITTIKTHDTISIELNDYSAELLARYDGCDDLGGMALPVISNQRMNDYLKELGKLCGIDQPVTITYYKGSERHDETRPKYELLTSHCGRRTFICNALMLGIQPEIVMKWTGHSDYKAMKPYIAVTDRAKQQAMALFNKKRD